MPGEKIDIARIKEARLEKDLSRLEISKKLGYKSYVAYYRKEEGLRKFSTNDVLELSKILDLKLDEFFLDNKLPKR